MQGALMVGHNCGGLGKMPGFYFRAELDNVQDMAHRREPLLLNPASSLAGLLLPRRAGQCAGHGAQARTLSPATRSKSCQELQAGLASWQSVRPRSADARKAQSGALNAESLLICRFRVQC